MRFKIGLFLGVIFFIAGLFTLPHYGINWDTINHLPRGQAYLHYFLTGNKDYSDLPKFSSTFQSVSGWYWQDPDSLKIKSTIPMSEVPTRSMYQLDEVDFNYFMERDGGGHPPLSDILSSGFNRVLFGKFRIINDIDAYRVYGIFLVSALVVLLFVWVTEVYGGISGLLSVLALATYPLFWSESHFNTEKDIPESVYWAFLFYSVWRGITQRSLKWILLSGIFFGLALGTKFNILFAIFALIPWVLWYWGKTYVFKRNGIKIFLSENIRVIAGAIIAFILGISIFVGSWPYLWPDPIGRVSTVTSFYKEIGTTTNFDSRFIGPKGINTYPMQAIFYTTPIITLILFSYGIYYALRKVHKEKHATSLLFLLWLLVPIVRVTYPGSNIYGGLRQIMEYIPALAVIAGIGGNALYQQIKKRVTLLENSFIMIAISVLLFLPITLKLISIHPNENVYFNSLIGGLAGARDRNFPFWGNSFGAAYRSGASFVNKHAEQGARLSYAYELIPNIPRILIRDDINFNNGFRSGYLQKGEYAITLTYQGTKERSYYDNYLESFIVPLYEEKVDGVPVMRVWKNSPEYYNSPGKEREDRDIKVEKRTTGIRIDLGETRQLSRLLITYNKNHCSPLAAGIVSYSVDGSVWNPLPGMLPDAWRISAMGEQPKDGSFIEPFVGQQAQFIDLALSPADTCLIQYTSAKVYYFEPNEQ